MKCISLDQPHTRLSALRINLQQCLTTATGEDRSNRGSPSNELDQGVCLAWAKGAIWQPISPHTNQKFDDCPMLQSFSIHRTSSGSLQGRLLFIVSPTAQQGLTSCGLQGIVPSTDSPLLGGRDICINHSR